MKYRLQFHGKVVLASTLLLLLLGVIMVYSSSLPVAHREYQDGLFFFKKHLLRLVIGLGLMMLTWREVRKKQFNLRHWVYPSTVLGLFLLVGVLYSPWGIKIRGAQRWLGWADYSFQPIEIVKICLLFCFAHLLACTREKPKNESYYFLALTVVMLPALYLMIKQPDLGNTLVMGALCFVMLFLAKVPFIYLASLSLMGLSAGMLWLTRASYVQQRLLAFIDPWQHANGSGFQTVQSLLALGSGGFWGVGLGAGQQKLIHLPEAYTDFIFAVIGEEWGLVGTGVVIVLFFIFIWAGLKIAEEEKDLFRSYFVAGLTSLIGLQALFNIWVVTGLFPTKGLPLPFISYGGTSLIVNLMGVGVLLAFASKRMPQKRAVKAERRPLNQR